AKRPLVEDHDFVHVRIPGQDVFRPSIHHHRDPDVRSCRFDGAEGRCCQQHVPNVAELDDQNVVHEMLNHKSFDVRSSKVQGWIVRQFRTSNRYPPHSSRYNATVFVAACSQENCLARANPLTFNAARSCYSASARIVASQSARASQGFAKTAASPATSASAVELDVTTGAPQ